MEINEITFRTLLHVDLDGKAVSREIDRAAREKRKTSTSLLTAWTDVGSRSQALYISSTYPALDPLRKGSAAAEL